MPDLSVPAEQSPVGRAAPLVCPQCHAAVGLQDKTCQTCGVDLELAATIIEREALAFTPAETSAPFIADVILPRFGEYLVRSGYITDADLQEALGQQRQLAEQGRTETIGQILLGLGKVTREQLDRASIRQVQELQVALNRANQQLQQRVNEQAQALQNAVQKLAELNALKANFVANISHELRTPLAQVAGYADLLNQGMLGALSQEQHDAVRVVLKGAQQLKKLIDDLIRFAGSMRGEMMLAWEDLAPGALLSEVIETARPKAEQAHLQLRVDVPPAMPPWRGDRDKLYWALNQLLDNAVKFTPGGGSVSVTVEQTDAVVRLSIADTGIGIPPEALPAIFAPFHQVDSSTTRRYGGTGLGLAIVKRIVEAHNGWLEVHSQPGQGSQFTVCLPLRDAGS